MYLTQKLGSIYKDNPKNNIYIVFNIDYIT